MGRFRLGQKRRQRSELHNLRKSESKKFQKRLSKLSFDKAYQRAILKKKGSLVPTANQNRAVLASMTPRAPEEWKDERMNRISHRAAIFQRNDDVRSHLFHRTRLEPQDRQPWRPFASGPVEVPAEFAIAEARRNKNYLSRQARKAKKATAKKRQEEA